MSCAEKIPNSRLVPRGTNADNEKVVKFNCATKRGEWGEAASQNAIIAILASEVIIAITDNNKYFINQSENNYPIGINADVTLNLPIGFAFKASATSTGNILIAANQAGVTIVAQSDDLTIGPGQTAIVSKTAANTWLLEKVSTRTKRSAGDIEYGSITEANTVAKLAGNTSTTIKILTQAGNGLSSFAPAWQSLSELFIPLLDSNGNLRLGFTGVASARLHVRGIGATSATHAILVENSNPSTLFALRNDNRVDFNVNLQSFNINKGEWFANNIMLALNGGAQNASGGSGLYAFYTPVGYTEFAGIRLEGGLGGGTHCHIKITTTDDGIGPGAGFARSIHINNNFTHLFTTNVDRTHVGIHHQQVFRIPDSGFTNPILRKIVNFLSADTLDNMSGNGYKIAYYKNIDLCPSISANTLYYGIHIRPTFNNGGSEQLRGICINPILQAGNVFNAIEILLNRSNSNDTLIKLSNNMKNVFEVKGDDKIGMFNAAPVAQATTALAAATFLANSSGIVNDTATYDGYTVGQAIKALRNIGILQ